MLTYQGLLRAVLETGEPHNDRTGTGTRSLFGQQLKLSMDRFPLLTTKYVSIANVAKELCWFLSGNTNANDLAAQGCHIWDEWATAEKCAKFNRPQGDLGPVYGALWRHAMGVDQIEELLHGVLFTPNSRRLIVTGWSPLLQREVELPPCHTLFQVKVHDAQALSLSVYCRSIDIFLGLPYNIASYGLLLHMLAWTTKRAVRSLVFSFGDLHLYNNHVEQAKLQLSRTPYRPPALGITREYDDSKSPLENLLSITPKDISVCDYQYHPAIKAEVSV